jgi:hypothetical protein
VAAAILNELKRLPDSGERVALGPVPVEVEVVENDTIMTAILGTDPKAGTESE